MRIAVVTGGYIEYDYVGKELETGSYDAVIACDSGCRFFLDTGRKFDYAVGDFDSIDEESYRKLMAEHGNKVTKYPSEKDYTDTEIAIKLAMDLIDKDTMCKSSEIDIYGATGTRLDHVLGNIELLYEPTMKGIKIAIKDSHNRIELIRDKAMLNRSMGYPYFSIIPFGEEATVSESGTKYELDNKRITRGITLGISNEIVADTAIITTSSPLVLILARD
ncbi:MAG: thiamine diphosphokinase [Lachnospiraceae bacterium]|nr:thiamine diphosphokinase [Lachnospiraceae bacterium]